MRSPLVVGNWKMHKDTDETASFFDTFHGLIHRMAGCDVVVCPPFVGLEAAVRAVRGTRIQVGAQNLHWAKEGPYTGEVSALMIRASGCSYVIVGHSERRKYFAETNEVVAQKTLAALDAGLTPIICVGEFERQNAQDFIAAQFRRSLATLSVEQFARVIVAYEPFWAIGSGDAAAPEKVGEAHRLIRNQATELFGQEAAKGMQLLYGGSVKTENASGLRAEPEIDGFLVGGASLDPKAFAAIANLWALPVS